MACTAVVDMFHVNCRLTRDKMNAGVFSFTRRRLSIVPISLEPATKQSWLDVSCGTRRRRNECFFGRYRHHMIDHCSSLPPTFHRCPTRIPPPSFRSFLCRRRRRKFDESASARLLRIDTVRRVGRSSRRLQANL